MWSAVLIAGLQLVLALACLAVAWRRGRGGWRLAIAGMVAAGAAIAGASWLAIRFAGSYVFFPSGRNLLTVTLGVSLAGAIFCGAWLIFSAMHAWTMARFLMRAAVPSHLAARLIRSRCRQLRMAVALRSVAIVATVCMGMAINPVGARFFISWLWGMASAMLLVRVLVGLVLPLLYCSLIESSAQDGAIEHASFYFLPLFILILLGEILAAGITAGMWGFAV